MKKSILLALSITIIFSIGSATEPDPKEANVMDVERNGQRFSVTLYHDDAGEEGYANWWQIETMDGKRLVRRELLHSHGTRNFTRSDTVKIPEKVSEVIVRGHDQTHGYGGRALIYNLETGETRVEQNHTKNIESNTEQPLDNQKDRNQEYSDRSGIIEKILDLIGSLL